mgnify:CR=1 FL=1
MTLPQLETASTRDWQESGWRIMPYNFTDVVVDPPAPCVEFKGWEPQDLVSVGGFELTEPGDEEERRWQKLYRYGEERTQTLGLKEEDIERLVNERRS